MHTGQYDGMIAMTMAHVDVAGGAMTRKPLNKFRNASRPNRAICRYGENPHQASVVDGVDRRRGVAGRCTRARSCPTRTCSISMRRCGSCSSSPSPARSSSSTRTRAASRRDAASTAHVRARGRPAGRRSVASCWRQPALIDVATATAPTATFIEGVIAPAVDDRPDRSSLRSRTCGSSLRPILARALEPFMGQDPPDMRSFLGADPCPDPDGKRAIPGRLRRTIPAGFGEPRPASPDESRVGFVVATRPTIRSQWR